VPTQFSGLVELGNSGKSPAEIDVIDGVVRLQVGVKQSGRSVLHLVALCRPNHKLNRCRPQLKVPMKKREAKASSDAKFNVFGSDDLSFIALTWLVVQFHGVGYGTDGRNPQRARRR
jgi:hypothetical protein